MMHRILVAVGLITSAQVIEAKTDKSLAQLAALTPAHFLQTADLKDDDLATVAIISTAGGFQHQKGWLKMVEEDNFLRASIDKTTGSTDFLVYQMIPYSGSLRAYDTVNYEYWEGRPKSERATVIGRIVVSCSSSRYGGSSCSYVEHIGFHIDEEWLRAVASQYRPGGDIAWQYKFSAQSGDEWRDGIVPAEVAGLLAAVDAYKAAHGLSKK